MPLLTALPLALEMVAGSKLVSAVVLASGRHPRRSSAAFLGGVAVGVLGPLTLWYAAFRVVRHTAVHGIGAGGSRRLIDWIVLGLLAVLMVVTFRRRRRDRPSGWLRRLQDPRPAYAFGLGLVLAVAVPSDELVMASVAGSMAGHGRPWWHLLPFTALTVLLLALPLLALLLFGDRAERLLPVFRSWTDRHSWLVSETVILVFAAFVVADLAGSFSRP
ncbi:GAP family protein [Micromonospora aurantiaca (nom. illeg.)]|uniref:GAP family protein n=1 Tax=Micromonospora aurantiaca (nom. illeg.) TaxID=47850 RepID=UPI003650ACE5